MRLNLSTSWIFRGWITYVVFTYFFAQEAECKPLQCGKNQYLKGSNCCNKCEPGHYLYADCLETMDPICLTCNSGEYQPDWTQEAHCLKQKFCDEGKGFKERLDNPVAEKPCECKPNLQCNAVNCEFCEPIPTNCPPGKGIERINDSTTGSRIVCVSCRKGLFSSGTNREPCTLWTNCKALGRREIQPGSAQTDAVCGPPVSGPSWVIVLVLSVITTVSLIILLLFCYKHKLKLLSVNLRSCVQNLKRTRIQQVGKHETLAPLYNSGGEGSSGGPGDGNCTLCQTTKLICLGPETPSVEPPIACPTIPSNPAPISMATGRPGEGQRGPGEGPQEVSEEEEEEEVGEGERSVAPLRVGSCACVTPVREPLEVGENEDCSQAVSPGTPGAICCCREGPGGEERDGAEKGRGRGGDRGVVDDQEIRPCGVGSLPSFSPPLQHTSAPPPPAPHSELCVSLSQAQARPEPSPRTAGGSRAKGQELYRLPSVESTFLEETTPAISSTVTSFNAMTTSSSVGELDSEKTRPASGMEQSRGLSWSINGGNRLPCEDTELECAPESLQSQLSELAPTSGQVSGNNNTTFISSGQVMNFSGDVIVVYVSQTSLGNEGDLDNAFGSPVQEQDRAPMFQSSLVMPGDSITQNPSQDSTLPVQEVMTERPRVK